MARFPWRSVLWILEDQNAEALEGFEFIDALAWRLRQHVFAAGERIIGRRETKTERERQR